jgi:hypothetical protein
MMLTLTLFLTQELNLRFWEKTWAKLRWTGDKLEFSALKKRLTILRTFVPLDYWHSVDEIAGHDR